MQKSRLFQKAVQLLAARPQILDDNNARADEQLDFERASAEYALKLHTERHLKRELHLLNIIVKLSQNEVSRLEGDLKMDQLQLKTS